MTAQSFAPSNTGPQLRATSRFERIVAATSFFLSGLLLWFRELRQLSEIWFMPDLKGYPQFYRDQAESMLNGGFAVPPESLGDECYVVDGACFGYYGITPSLLRIPFLALTNGDLSPLMAAGGYLLNVAAALVILMIVWTQLPASMVAIRTGRARLLFASMAIALGPGSLALMVTYPDVGNEAILWGSGFTLLLVALALIYLRDGNTFMLAFATVAGTLAGLSRPPMMVSASMIALVVLALALRSRRPIQDLLIAGFGAVLPVVAALGVFVAKFGEVLPDMRRNIFISTSPYWQGILAANGGQFTGWQFVPTNIWNFVRPDGVSYLFTSPRGAFFTPIDHVWPLSEGMMHGDPSASLTNLIPVALLLTGLLLCGAWFIGPIGLRQLTLRLLFLALAAASGLVVTWAHVAMTTRNLVDAWPFLVVGAVGGAVVLLRLMQNRRVLAYVGLVVVATLTVAGVGTSLVVMR